MALNASSKLLPKVIAMQKRGVAVILQRTEAAAQRGALLEKKAHETYRATVRVRTRRTAVSESYSVPSSFCSKKALPKGGAIVS